MGLGAIGDGKQSVHSRCRGEPSPDEVRDQLEIILGSSSFNRSERLRRFLRFTVEKVLAGQAGQIKEYTIGREVFDRGDSYDPRTQSIVRIEARRLRARLRDYYQKSGIHDVVIIEFSPGNYVPAFRFPAGDRPSGTSPASGSGSHG
jgi:hypothetical protein